MTTLEGVNPQMIANNLKLTLSVGTLLVQSSLGVWRYLENVDEVIVHV